MAGSKAMSDELDPNEYMLLHERCAVCHWPSRRHGRWMELHHIVGGAGRKDLFENWLALCSRCHHAVHNKLPEYGEIPKGAVLSAKEEEDGSVDIETLASLRRRKALPYEKEPIPKKFLDDRRKQGGSPWP